MPTPLATPQDFMEFAAFKDEQIGRLSALEPFALAAIKLVENVSSINEGLRTAEIPRADLAISERAEMLPITDPYELAEISPQFAQKFIFLRYPPSNKPDIFESAGSAPAASREEVLALRNVSSETVEAHNALHANKAAFRMLTLFPAFTADLIVNMSDPRHRRHPARFEAQQFLAYKVTRKLVDVTDPGVRRADGSVDERYLLR